MLTIENNETKLSVLQFIKGLQCCNRCIVKYLGVTTPEAYRAPENHIKHLIAELNGDVCRDEVNQCACRVCLGILEDKSLEKLVLKIPVDHATSYKHENFIFAMTLPKVLRIRERSMFLHMKEKFPQVYADECDLLSTKYILQLALMQSFCSKIGKVYSKSSNLTANIDITYEDDEKESENIKLLNRVKCNSNPSKTVIASVLESTDEKTFREHFNVPSDLPSKNLDMNVTFTSGMSYIGGRYLKFSRDMGQTPWIIDDKQMTQFCLSDIIFESIVKILGYKKENMTFSASGREDSDVRMLGNGRPFYIQILDAKDPLPTFEKFREIEEEIIKSNMVAVVRLQPVSIADIKQIKTGEELKNKHYSALCITTCPIEEAVGIINGIGSVEICQRTPLRVLHRRTLSDRKKQIYKIEASLVPGSPNLFYLNLITQAGTYIKEFVHGDFHRTQPNLTQLLGKPTDLVALDVTRVELDWPL